MFHRSLELQYDGEMIQTVRRCKMLIVHGDEFSIRVRFHGVQKYFSASSPEMNLHTPQAIPAHAHPWENHLTNLITSEHQQPKASEFLLGTPQEIAPNGIIAKHIDISSACLDPQIVLHAQFFGDILPVDYSNINSGKEPFPQ